MAEHESDRLDSAMRAAFGPRPPEDSRLLLRALASTDDPLVRLATGSERIGSSRYELIGEIARGGVGIVYKAHDRELGRDVALKVLRPDFAADPSIRDRFLEEAQVGGQLQHPGIVPVYEIGLQADDRPFISMKLVRGRTLGSLLAERDTAEPDRARFLSLFEQVCRTVAYAHARGVIHRDLKPANVMVGKFGEVQVVDWGFAKVLKASDGTDERPLSTRRTESGSDESVAGSVLGTPAYMPPEQAAGHVDALDERADVFALGAMLCEILTGSPPYRPEKLLAVGEAELAQAVRSIEESGSPAALVNCARQCLAYDPEIRPRDAEAIADAVAAYSASVVERARQAELDAAEAQARAASERRTRFAMALAALFLVGIAAVWFTYDSREARRRDRMAQRISVELDETRRRHGIALAASPGDLRPWREARSAAARLTSIAAHEQTAAAFAAKVERHALLVETLDKIRLPLDQTARGYAPARRRESAWRASEYTRVLHENGFDPASKDLGARIARSPLGPLLSSALDRLALARRYAGAGDVATLFAAASAADPSASSRRVRDAIVADDPALLDALAKSPDLLNRSADSIALLGFVLAEEDRLDASIAVYLAGQQRYPHDFILNFELGTRIAQRDWAASAAAIPYLQAALALRPDSIEVRRRLATALKTERRHVEALAVVREALRLEPQTADLHARQSILLRYTDVAAAEKAARTALQLDPSEALAHTAAGLVASERENEDAAVAAFRRAIQCDPDHLLGYLNLYLIYIDRGAYEQAQAMAQRAHEIGSGRAGWPYPTAHWVTWSKNLARAKLILPALLRGESMPTDERIWFDLAHVAEQQRRHGVAARCWREYWNAAPTDFHDHRGIRVLRCAENAALAGLGVGADAKRWNRAARTDWRQQALAWLRKDLAWVKQQILIASAAETMQLRRRLRMWGESARLRAYRDGDPRLPADEKNAWRALFAEAAAVAR